SPSGAPAAGDDHGAFFSAAFFLTAPGRLSPCIFAIRSEDASPYFGSSGAVPMTAAASGLPAPPPPPPQPGSASATKHRPSAKVVSRVISKVLRLRGHPH